MIELHLGDCLEILSTMPEMSVDAIVTDPPYGLSFMGKKWDYDVPDEAVWQECLRVLKPGGHLLCFAGTRTQHRMAVRIEDAGFEIRDMIAWVYGSGFPKSLDVSKAIDKAAGAEREVVGTVKLTGTARKSTTHKGHGAGATNASDPREYIETFKSITAPATPEAQQWSGWGTALKPALEPITVARKPLNGTVAENVLRHGTGAINVDGCRVETNGERPTGSGKKSKGVWDLHAGSQYQGHGNVTPEAGRFPANFIHDGSEEVVELFPVTKPSKATQRGSVKIFEQGEGQWIGESTQRGHDDSGGSAARFFYCAKASKADRDEGLESGLQWIDSLELIWYDNTLNLISEVFLWECQGQNQSMGLSGEALPLKVILGDMMQEPEDKDSPMLSHGKQRMVKYLKAIKFTTLTGIKKTIELKILNFLNLLPTSEYTEDAIKTMTGSGLSLVESVALKNLLKLIITKEKTEYHPGASNAAKITQQKTNAKDELKRLCSRNTHSTVKPTDLMRYLCRLVTPPGGIVLDPFMGSGSTGKAAVLEGFNFIGIEREPEYMEIAKARIHAAIPTDNATDYEQLSLSYL